MNKTINVLLVEDNPGDVDLTRETLTSPLYDIKLSVACDGIEAMNMLNAVSSWSDPGRPTIILLDLNLPRKDGRQVLACIKSHDLLQRIPVVVLSSSDSEKDITSCYQLGANCYITKPTGLQAYRDMMRTLQEFWLGSATLPQRSGHSLATEIAYKL
jgi:chemotaxis family two-component system response regulator Rcp1